MLVTSVDDVVAQWSQPETVVLDGEIRCLDCDLKTEHGVATQCDRFGHRGVLMTKEGRAWNIVEQEASLPLVRDEAYIGHRVRVEGRLFRKSGGIVVTSFRILS